jgi:beta-lactam-binding protein with PASTA domain
VAAKVNTDKLAKRIKVHLLISSNFFMGLLKFLSGKTFFKHLGIAILLLVLLLWLTVKALDIYTQNGEHLQVPGLTGVNIQELEQMALPGDFDFVVIDSVYDDHFGKGEIVLQDPAPGSNVKSGRKIYVTIVASQPEMLAMPDLVDLSLRQALNELKAESLKLEKLSYVENFAKNAVLAQRIDGDTVAPGTQVLKGSSVELVLGKGLGNEKAEVPFLLGLTESEAIALINNASLNVGYLKYQDSRDKMHSRVYKQQPGLKEKQKTAYGAYVDLWFRSDQFFNFDSLVEVYNSDTLKLIPEKI